MINLLKIELGNPILNKSVDFFPSQLYGYFRNKNLNTFFRKNMKIQFFCELWNVVFIGVLIENLYSAAKDFFVELSIFLF